MKKENKDEKPIGESGVDLLRSLRRLMPIRQLAYFEHLLIAERQAQELNRLLEQTQPGISLDWLSANRLGNIEVFLVPRWKMEGLSGITKWADGRWLIGVNRSNSHARRRFTLCHEFKHVLDGHRDKVTYTMIDSDQREQIANYFAACYLMPKSLIRRAWTHGIQDPEALAGLFKVSTDAMERRLKYLQYLDIEPDRPVTTYFRLQLPDIALSRSVRADLPDKAMVNVGGKYEEQD